MAASGIRCTMFIQDGRQGISETHVTQSTDFTTTKVDFIRLFKARMKLCGPPCLPFRGRMALIGGRRQVKLLTNTDLATIGAAQQVTMGSDGGAVGPNNSDIPATAILIKLMNNDGRIKNLWLAGVPDPVITENPEGPGITVIPQYGALMAAYLKELTTGPWCFVGQMLAGLVLNPTPILDVPYRIGPPGQVGVVIAGGVGGVTLTTKLKVFGMKMTNNAYLAANGIKEIAEISVDSPVAGQTTFWLRNTSGIDVNQIKFRGSVQTLEYQDIKIQDGSVTQQTTHRRGNRFLSGPGRRTKKTKVSL